MVSTWALIADSEAPPIPSTRTVPEASTATGGYNVEIGGPDCIIPDMIAGVDVEHVGYIAQDRNTNSFASKITSLVMGKNLKTVGDYAFRANAIVIISFSNSLESIGQSAFANNQIGGTLIFPSSLTVLGPYSFSQNNISIVDLSACVALTTVGTSCFQDNQIQEVMLNSAIKSIEAFAFYGNSITKIIIGTGVYIDNDPIYPAFGTYGADFLTLYNANGKLAGTYEYSAGTWSKTS